MPVVSNRVSKIELSQRGGPLPAGCQMVFKRMCDPPLINALIWAFRLSALWIVLDHPVYIPRPPIAPLGPRPYRGPACTVQGMARVRSGQAAAWPLVSDRSVRRGSGVKRDFACTSTTHVSPVLVVLRPQSRLMLEGRTRTLRGPSPDLSSGRSPCSGFQSSWISSAAISLISRLPGMQIYVNNGSHDVRNVNNLNNFISG
jgi:hypothetical protein